MFKFILSILVSFESLNLHVLCYKMSNNMCFIKEMNKTHAERGLKAKTTLNDTSLNKICDTYNYLLHFYVVAFESG